MFHSSASLVPYSLVPSREHIRAVRVFVLPWGIPTSFSFHSFRYLSPARLFLFTSLFSLLFIFVGCVILCMHALERPSSLSLSLSLPFSRPSSVLFAIPHSLLHYTTVVISVVSITSSCRPKRFKNDFDERGSCQLNIARDARTCVCQSRNRRPYMQKGRLTLFHTFCAPTLSCFLAGTLSSSHLLLLRVRPLLALSDVTSVTPS